MVQVKLQIIIAKLPCLQKIPVLYTVPQSIYSTYCVLNIEIGSSFHKNLHCMTVALLSS